MLRHLIALAILFVSHFVLAAEPPADPFANKAVILKREQIPLKGIDGTGKPTTLGDSGRLMMLSVSKSDGDTVTVRYRAQDVRLSKADVLLPADAATHYSEVLKKNPMNADALVRRGLAYSLLGQSDKAIPDLNKAVQLDPKAPSALNYRGAVLSRNGESEKALADFTTAIKLAPTWWVPLFNRASVYHGLGKQDEALEDVKAAIKLDSGWASAFYLQGQIWEKVAVRKGFREGAVGREFVLNALASYSEAFRLTPSPLYLTERGRMYAHTHQYVEAIGDLEKTLKLDPQSLKAMELLSFLLASVPDVKSRNGKRAVELGTNALKLSEGRMGHGALAAGYAELGQFEKAVESQKQEIKIRESLKLPTSYAEEQLSTYEAKRPLRLNK